MTADTGQRLAAAMSDRYIIQRELGGGGMSRVFLATEVALGREVVIKMLAPELAHGMSAERFAREIAVVARLQQANIVPVLTAGEADGLAWFAMPYVRGESLRAHLAQQGALPIAEAIGILKDVARALAYSHVAGVIHRDIKPENILLSGGAAVVTDFGIAKALTAARTLDGSTAPDTTLTQMGHAIGTPAYMAPEQAVGDVTADHRVDVYAWGLVAWELLVGRHPFSVATTTSALMAAHIAEVPASVRSLRPAIPEPLDALIARALEKDPSRRPATAGELLKVLETVDSQPAALVVQRTPRARARWMAVAITVAIVAIAAVLWTRNRSGGSVGTPRPPAAPASLAVLPFVNTSGNPQDEYFSDGMTDELAHALSRLQGLQLAGRSSSFSFKGKSVPAADVGRTLNVGNIIEGTVRRSGDRLRVTAQLVATSDGHVVWSDSFERAGTDVFAVQDAFTKAIVAALAPMLGTNATSPANAAAAADTRGTTNADAYERYLRGRFFWAQRGAEPLDSALVSYREAIRLDPTFARAWAGLALTHALRPNFNVFVSSRPAGDSAEAAARHALSLDSTGADAHTALGLVRLLRLDRAGAAPEFAAARRAEPQNASAHSLSALYFAAIGDSAQADREFGVALAIDPLSATTINSRSSMLSDQRRFAEALAGFRHAGDLGAPFVPRPWSTAARSIIWSGLGDSSYAANRSAPVDKYFRARLGLRLFAAAATGRWSEARALRDTIGQAGNRAVLDLDRGMAAVAFGERAAAATYFVRSIEQEGVLPNILFSLCDPMLDAVRDEPAWRAFLARHHFEDCRYRSPWPIKPAPAR